LPPASARRWFVALETALDRAGLRERIVVAVGGNPAEPTAFDHACRTLAEAAGLLVLDNLETPWEADMPGVQDDLRRLAAIPGLSLLASLRGSATPDLPAFTHRLRLGPLPADPARSLFLTPGPGRQWQHGRPPSTPRSMLRRLRRSVLTCTNCLSVVVWRPTG
jgi:hypothetical protein